VVESALIPPIQCHLCDDGVDLPIELIEGFLILSYGLSKYKLQAWISRYRLYVPFLNQVLELEYLNRYVVDLHIPLLWNDLALDVDLQAKSQDLFHYLITYYLKWVGRLFIHQINYYIILSSNLIGP
jgi:hypothetical protein